MKSVTFSFDDGTVADRRLVSLLNRYHAKATFNLCSSEWGREHSINHLGVLCDHSEVLREEVSQLYQGHEIACHTKTHPEHMDALSEEDLIWQIEENRRDLESLTTTAVIGLAYPWGVYNDSMIGVIRKNTRIQYARTTVCTGRFDFPEDFLAWHPTYRALDDRLQESIRAFLALPDTGNLLLFIWGHSFEFNKTERAWERFEQILCMLSEKNSVQFLTNAQAMRWYRENA